MQKLGKGGTACGGLPLQRHKPCLGGVEGGLSLYGPLVRHPPTYRPLSGRLTSLGQLPFCFFLRCSGNSKVCLHSTKLGLKCSALLFLGFLLTVEAIVGVLDSA